MYLILRVFFVLGQCACQTSSHCGTGKINNLCFALFYMDGALHSAQKRPVLPGNSRVAGADIWVCGTFMIRKL